jgi:EAL domain-containing protein (putative c-di-GMP-specific phosphodiesterase class I)
VKKIVKKAQANGIQLIAEAVQEAAFLPIIWQYEIPYVQGFFLGVPTDEMTYDFRNLLI